MTLAKSNETIVAMETAIWWLGKFDLSCVSHHGMLCITNLVDVFSKCHLIGVLHEMDGIDLDVWLILTWFCSHMLHIHTNTLWKLQSDIMKKSWGLAIIKQKKIPVECSGVKLLSWTLFLHAKWVFYLELVKWTCLTSLTRICSGVRELWRTIQLM